MDLSFLSQTHNPYKVIVAYKSGHDYYLEVHNVDKNVLSPGVPLTKRGMNKLAQAVKDTSFKNRAIKIKGLVPDNLLYFNCDNVNPKIIWFTPSGKRKLYWIPAMGIPDGEAQVPAMVFVADGENLDVYALHDDQKPTEDTKLFKAPFCNVNDGSVCTGNVVMKEHSIVQDIMKEFEHLFWDTRFSGHNMDDSPILKGKNFYDFWKSQAANPENKFPVEILQKSKKKLSELI